MSFIPVSLPIACALTFLATVQVNRAEDTNGLNNLKFAIHGFNADLYKKIGESNVGKNVLFSPTSIYPGAGGKTKSQLASALQEHDFQSDKGKFYKSIKILLKTLSTSKVFTLNMANSLFGQKGFKFKDEYVKITDEYFRAKLKALDFRKDPSGSRYEINRWVAYMTSNKIKELFPQDTITSDTLLVLANAVYFKSRWLHKFDKQDTKPQTFKLSKSQKIKVPLMNMLWPYRFGYHKSETLAWEVLELPYIGGKVSMLIFLPNEVDGLSLLEERLGHNSTVEVLDSLIMGSVNVSLPKFTFQQTLNLKDTLKALGMKNLFENADLSGIDDSDPLILSESKHKAYIAVNEDGTEAAAATGMSILTGSSPMNKQQPINFIVDRPFMILVVEKTSGVILFFGRINNPLHSN